MEWAAYEEVPAGGEKAGVEGPASPAAVEEEEEEEDYIGPRAFKIDGELGPDAGPPMDGFDYLRRVRFLLSLLLPPSCMCNMLHAQSNQQI